MISNLELRVVKLNHFAYLRRLVFFSLVLVGLLEFVYSDIIIFNRDITRMIMLVTVALYIGLFFVKKYDFIGELLIGEENITIVTNKRKKTINYNDVNTLVFHYHCYNNISGAVTAVSGIRRDGSDSFLEIITKDFKEKIRIFIPNEEAGDRAVEFFKQLRQSQKIDIGIWDKRNWV